MKVSEEIKKLRKKLKPLIDDHVEWLMIGLEYRADVKTWYATPQYEGGGDGFATYIEVEGCADRVLQGEGKSLPSAIKDLNKRINKVKKAKVSLFRWR